MSTGEPMQSLFTINASEDVEQACRLAKYIERLPNVRVTLSGNVAISAGDAIVGELKAQIKDASGVLFLLTPMSIDSEWATLELGMARGMDKPVRILQGGPVPLRVPFDAAEYRSFDIRELEDPEVVQEMLSSLSASA